MIYAIGDIHGSMLELKALHNIIMRHSKAHDEEHTVVFLGDYIDRGENSKHVVDFLSKKPFKGFKHFYLKGNHEDMVKNVYDLSPEMRWGSWVNMWVGNGGDTTLRDYGLFTHDIGLSTNDPHDLLEFIKMCQPNYRKGNFFFVHAGIKPHRLLKNQTRDDMMWIRREFLEYTGDWEETFGKKDMIVVHGHTPISYDPRRNGNPKNEPLVLNNRINLDTGLISTGKHGCIVIDNNGNELLEIL